MGDKEYNLCKGGNAMKSAEIIKKNFVDTMYYEDKPIVKYQIKIPKVCTRNYHPDMVINRYYEQMTGKLLYEYIPQLYHDAAARYIESQKEGYPFLMTEFDCIFTVSYNRKGFLSLYFDTYLFTGGANGEFSRIADTWDTYTGHRMELGEFFRPGFDYRSFLIDRIIEQAGEQKEDYFENATELIEQYFDPEHYYLTDEGFAIFYEAYQIGPRTDGIPVFIIPYSAFSGEFRVW